jgi:hypothetical protein
MPLARRFLRRTISSCIFVVQLTGSSGGNVQVLRSFQEWWNGRVQGVGWFEPVERTLRDIGDDRGGWVRIDWLLDLVGWVLTLAAVLFMDDSLFKRI